jgi:hypothetical protein
MIMASEQVLSRIEIDQRARGQRVALERLQAPRFLPARDARPILHPGTMREAWRRFAIALHGTPVGRPR